MRGCGVEAVQDSQGQEILTVSEIGSKVRELLTGTTSLKGIRVRGEISDYYKGPNYHLFDLKEEEAKLSCIIWLTIKSITESEELKDGDKVVLEGNMSAYANKSVYQLAVQNYKKEGIGDLHKKYVDLKNKLEAEGLFSLKRKEALPTFPQKIGIVTSETAAALQDMLKSFDAWPGIEIIKEYSKVQGIAAAAELSQGIKKLDGKVDLIIVGRGGGSPDDLWAFNDENLARTIANSKTPIISAVGHTTDEVISDFVANVCASTPTAAANLIVGKMNELKQQFIFNSQKLHKSVEVHLYKLRQLIDNTNVYRRKSIETRIGRLKQLVDSTDVIRRKKDVLSGIALYRKDLNYTKERLDRANQNALRREKRNAFMRKIEVSSALLGFILLLAAAIVNLDSIIRLLLGLIGFLLIVISFMELKATRKVKYNGKSPGVIKMSTIEETVERLKQIVVNLESEDVPLEEALRLYEEGVKLSKLANEFLTKAETRIKQLSAMEKT